MAVDITAPLTGTVATELRCELHLAGPWAAAPTVTTADGAPLSADLADGVLTVAVPAGTTTVDRRPLMRTTPIAIWRTS
jgi:hypothetical protein